jgi:hypothetical protein
MDIEQSIKGVIDLYVPILMLQHFTFEINKDDGAYFTCKFCYPHFEAVISYSEQANKDFLAGKDISRYVVHELCHLITDPLYSKAFDRFVSKNEIEDERERLTDWIARMVMRLLNGN